MHDALLTLPLFPHPLPCTTIAKLAIWGFSNTIAREGQKNNVLCNTIAPIAGSRMTETVMPQELVQALRPEFVAPLVAFLVSEGCTENGSLFEVGAGLFTKLRWQRSKGVVFRLDKTFTPGAVAAKWEQVGPNFPAQETPQASSAPK